MGRLVWVRESPWREALETLSLRVSVVAPVEAEAGVLLERHAAGTPVQWNTVRPVEPLKALFFRPRESVTESPATESDVRPQDRVEDGLPGSRVAHVPQRERHQVYVFSEIPAGP